MACNHLMEKKEILSGILNRQDCHPILGKFPCNLSFTHCVKIFSFPLTIVSSVFPCVKSLCIANGDNDKASMVNF